MVTESSIVLVLLYTWVIGVSIPILGILLYIFGILLYVCFHLLLRTGNPVPHSHNAADTVLSSHDGPLDQMVIDSLPVIHPAAGTPAAAAAQFSAECVVCISSFEEKEKIRLLPKCKHAFHVDCIDVWFSSHSTCPICRSKVELVVVEKQTPWIRVMKGLRWLGKLVRGKTAAPGIRVDAAGVDLERGVS